MLDKESTMKVAVALQPIANMLEDCFKDLAGKPTGFLLLVSTSGTVQYVSNVKRAQGVDILNDLLKRWKDNKADIPALYNPDLKSQFRLLTMADVIGPDDFYLAGDAETWVQAPQTWVGREWSQRLHPAMRRKVV
jgi:hypothetical protein